jgi:hypothetical protein
MHTNITEKRMTDVVINSYDTCDFCLECGIKIMEILKNKGVKFYNE